MSVSREQVFSSEVLPERERQLVLALLDCAGVCYDVNFTQNRVLGEPIQVIDGVHYRIFDLIGLPKGCSWTEMIEYWSARMPPEEASAFVAMSAIPNIQARYAAGEHQIIHKFWTYDVLGNTMLAEQIIRLYEDSANGDLLGLIYVSNAGEIYALQQKETELKEQYEEATRRVSILQSARDNLPGGYHRCAISKGYPFLFVSHSFEQLVGYTREQLQWELDNCFINLVIPEDLHRFESFEKELAANGNADIAYRIRRRDGEIRWVQDSSLVIDWEGERCLQCIISDITDFVARQEAFAKEKAEFQEFAENIPCGYHRCTTEDGFRLEFVSDSFVETVGYTREELLGRPFLDLVAPEDRALFLSHEPQLIESGMVELVYRLLCKDGSRRWIKDSTVRVEIAERETYQCILADITVFVNRQEEIQRRNLELVQKETLMQVMEQTMPGGYHRCRAEEGCPFVYIGNHFTDIVGFSREEIERDFGNQYANLLWDEDKDKISTYDQMLSMRGKGNFYDTSVYRIKHKDGGYRWVTDSTMFVDMGEDSFFQAIISDVTEYIEGLNAARKEAEASNQAKSNFLFNASHDIRTPMNAIKGFAHIIAQNSDNSALVAETVRKIQTASDTLMTLMNDILDLARIERGKEEIHAEAIDLRDQERALYEMFASTMEATGITFRVESSIEHIHVFCDSLKLTRVRMNMLSNAKKFTPPGGSVLFGADEVACDGKTVTIRFYTRDSGIGMSEEFLSRAFEQFERERTSTESGVMGSGLGLSIVKRLVELMGGTVDIRSAVGKGTEISATLTFPIAEETDYPEKMTDPARTDLSGFRVLLAEDNDFNREIARYLLGGIHMEVDEAENGLVCIRKLQEAEPGYYDLVLMDIQMPVMNGYAATEAIRAMPDPMLAGIPIIAMTANAFEEDKKKCFSVGMNGHIGKPIDIGILIKEIKSVLKNGI